MYWHKKVALKVLKRGLCHSMIFPIILMKWTVLHLRTEKSCKKCKASVLFWIVQGLGFNILAVFTCFMFDKNFVQIHSALFMARISLWIKFFPRKVLQAIGKKKKKKKNDVQITVFVYFCWLLSKHCYPLQMV